MHLMSAAKSARLQSPAAPGPRRYTDDIHRRCGSSSLLIGIISVLLITSCNGGDSSSDSATSGERGGDVSPKTAPARATVLRLWNEIEAGSPSLTSEYDPRLVRLLGKDLILTVFDSAPPEYFAPPRVKEIHQVPSGILVQVEGKGPGQDESIPVSFLVAKVGQRWLVRYDSNLINRVRGQIQAEVAQGLPRTEATQDRAAMVASQAVLEIRGLFAEGPRKGTLPPR
jgi:hypothetical protein